MKNKVIFLLIIMIIMSISFGCATGKDFKKSESDTNDNRISRMRRIIDEISDSEIKLARAVAASDRWWMSIENENPAYYEEIDLGKVIFHLCGSRKKLAEVYNERYPDNPFDLRSNVYMFTDYGKTPPVHVWLVVKVRDGKVILHKWATGHEAIRLLSCFTNTLTNADDY